MAAVDLILKTLMCSKEFTEASDKNWDAVAKLIPGSTPQQCCKRWNELQCVPSIHRGMHGFANHSSSVQQIASKLLKYNLINDEESKSAKNYTTSGNGSSQACKSMTKTSDELENHEETHSEKDSSSKRESNSGHNQKSHSKQSTSHKSQSSIRESIASQGFFYQAPNAIRYRIHGDCVWMNDIIEKLESDWFKKYPNMVIHVCDESKNLKQDFSCPRDLLIKEMRYFAEYLSVEAQRWEEVDISVHCDVQIFDWLMRYVKQGIVEKGKITEDKQPKLEPNNVISILISSDFLKMDSLVKECVEYCHENMSAIVATPCNMNCINDKLVTSIADLYNHNELDDIKDRKDKFKSKLYCKKIEDLFDPDKSSLNSPTSATTMYRCSACKRLLTAESEKKLQCVPNRLMINRQGRISFIHVRDPNWNVNDHIQGLREKLKSWKEVYWRLWGSVNILYCYRCGCYFPCSELGHCHYHPASAEYSKTGESIIGVYPCCRQQVLRFDTVAQQVGCSYRDHRVSRNISISSSSSKQQTSTGEKATSDDKTLVNKEDTSKDITKEAEPTSQNSTRSNRCASSQSTSVDVINNPIVVEDLHHHRNLVDIPSQRLMSARNSELDIFAVEEDVITKRSQPVDCENSTVLPDSIDPSERKPETQQLPPIRRSRSRAMQRIAMRRLKGQPGNDDDQDLGEDEDQPESEDTEPETKGVIKSKLTRKVQSASRKDFSTFKSYKWDLMRSSRWNQDAQREEDQKRMMELVVFLTKQRQTSLIPDSTDKQKPKEYIGGLYSKIEHQFRLSQQPVNTKNPPGSTVSLTGQRTRKNAPKS